MREWEKEFGNYMVDSRAATLITVKTAIRNGGHKVVRHFTIDNSTQRLFENDKLRIFGYLALLIEEEYSAIIMENGIGEFTGYRIKRLPDEFGIRIKVTTWLVM